MPSLLRLFLLLSLPCALLLSGCGQKETPVARGFRDNILLLGNGSEPPNLDPAVSTDTVSFHVQEKLWEPLLEYDPVTNTMVPAAAERYTLTPDGLLYTFHLRPNGRWSNGDPLTAHDFEFGMRRYLEPKMAAPYTEFFKGIKNAIAYSRGPVLATSGEKALTWDDVGIKALDDLTLRIEMEHPNLALTIFLLNQYFYPLHRRSLEAYGPIDGTRDSKYFRTPALLTNGPFRLKSWTPNKILEIEKNPFYWDAANVRLNAVSFFPIDNVETEYNSFRAAQIHKTSTVPTTKIEFLQTSGDPAFRQFPYFGTYYYEFNLEKPPFDNPLVRRALTYAIDRPRIIEFITRGGQQPAQSFIPPGVNQYQPDATFTPNLDEARRLLAEAGYPGGAGFPPVTLMFNTLEGHRLIAEAVQQMWKEQLGIAVTLENQEWKVFLETRQQGNYQIARAAWVGGLDMAGYLDIFESRSGNNNSRYRNPEFDRLVALGAREADPQRRIKIFQDAERILLQDLPIAPIYHYTLSQLIHPGVVNWHNSPIDYRTINAVYLDPGIPYAFAP